MADPSPELAAQLQTLASSYAENPGRYYVPYAGLLREAGQPDRAEEILRENLKRFPGLSPHVLLGRCLADRGAHQEASNEFHYVLSIDPQNLIALRTLAEMAAADGRTADARRWYDDLLAVDPMNADARASLGRLGAAGADAATADLPLAEPTGWGGAEEAAAAGPAGTIEDEALEWGNLDLGAPAPSPYGDAPVEEPGFAALEFGEVELDGGLPPLAWGDDAAPEAGAAGHDDLPLLDFGTEAEAEDASAAPEPGSVPDDDAAPELVTETMAELYASQGLTERAAEVYRELLQRRGDEPGLRRRLAELEGAGGAEPAADAGDDAFAESVSAGFGPEQAERAPWEAPTVAPTEGGAGDGFDLLVIDESAELDGDLHPPATAEEAAELSADWAVAAAPLEEQEEALEPAQVAEAVPAGTGRTMRGYFDALLGWAPAVGDAAAPAPEPAPADDEPAAGAEPEEPLPWELPSAAPEPLPGLAEAEAEAAPAPPTDGFSFEEFFAGEAEPEPAPAPPPPAAPAAAAAGSGTEAAGAPPAGGEDDEDLESFQAWLQSLKR